MKKIAFIFVVSVLLSGCMTDAYRKQLDFSSATTLQQKRDVLIKYLPYYDGRNQNLPNIRNEFLKYGGEDNKFLNDLISECYKSNSDGCAYDFYLNALEQKKYDVCSKEPVCYKKYKIDSAAQELNSTYYLVMARNPYDQSEFDLNLRELCKSAGIGQRRGITLEQIKRDVEQEPGLSPEVRGQFRDVAESCWILSDNGIPDGTVKIRSAY